jgi:hypothetical protein
LLLKDPPREVDHSKNQGEKGGENERKLNHALAALPPAVANGGMWFCPGGRFSLESHLVPMSLLVNSSAFKR